MADIDLTTGALQLVQAGHPHPVILRADGTIDRLGNGGFPVGLLEEADFDLICDRLAPGDRLLLMSDGVTECTDSNGIMLSEDSLFRLLSGLMDTHDSGFLESMIWTLAQCRGDQWFEDDVSAILVEFGTEGA